MKEALTRKPDFEPLWRAAERWLPAAQSAVYRAGLLGEALRRSDEAPLAGDLTHLWIPGLAALGVEARLLPLPPEGSGLQRPPNDPEEIILFGFAGPLEYLPPEEIDDSTPIPVDTDPQIIAQARLSAATAVGFHRQVADGLAVQEATHRPRFSHALCLQKSSVKAPRRDSIQAALHRWLAWHAAYPERAPHETDRTDPACTLAAAFLSEVIGTRRDFVSNRLRYAAQCFEAAQIAQAYHWLQEAGIAVWQLPAAPAEALRAPSEQPLSNLLRRELIYLARAGTLPLKTLAARRLTYERHYPDACKTLHQLRFDPDPWVRAAARPTSP